MSATASSILKMAASQIGTVETPVNVCKYNTWYYGKKVSGTAFPWCAAFASWVFNQCGAMGLIKKNVSTVIMWQWFKDAKQNVKTPVPGDVAFFNWSGGSTTQHVGIVEKVVSATVIQTIEGNTSDSNYSNGGMVLRRQRNMKYVVGYGRPKYAPEPFNKYKVRTTRIATVRAKASSKGATVKKLKKNKKCKILGVSPSGKWLKVKSGWIYARYTKKV